MDRPRAVRSARAPLPLWKKFWILFSAIWILVAALNLATLVAFEDEVPQERLLTLLVLTFAVPAALYAAGWLREFLRRDSN